MTLQRNPRDERLVKAFVRWFRRQPQSPSAVAEEIGVSPNTVLRLLPPEVGGNDKDWKEIQSGTRGALMELLREEGALPPQMGGPLDGGSSGLESA